MLSSVDLPEPDGPSRTDELAGVEIEVDAGQRVHLDLAGAVGLGETPCLEHDFGHAIPNAPATLAPLRGLLRGKARMFL